MVLVLFLMVWDSVFDCVKGLEMGVDDYFVKLFVFFELLVRVCILLCWGSNVVL